MPSVGAGAIHPICFGPSTRTKRESEAEQVLLQPSPEFATGPYNFDKNGDSLQGYNVVHNDKGNIVIDWRIDFYQG
jgi:hypothetical protein